MADLIIQHIVRDTDILAVLLCPILIVGASIACGFIIDILNGRDKSNIRNH